MRFPLLPLACAATAAWLAACAPSTRPILLDGGPAPADAEKRWEKYGAYYVFDELFAEASEPWGTIIVNKRIKILTREGASAGAVEVPRYSDLLVSSRLGAADSAGAPMRLDTAAMMAGYRKNGKLVFPKAGPGCVLDIRMEFRRMDPIPVLEHWFSNTLPVAHGRLTFSKPDRYGFEFATYGPVREGTTLMEKPDPSLHYRAWEVKDVAPRSRVDFQEEIDAAEPRVSAVMRTYGPTPVISNWEGLGKKYQELVFKTSFFASSLKLNRKTDELCRGKATPAEKAEAIFGWVSDNISLKSSELRTIDPDEVIRSGQGNIWEMAAVLKGMFLRAGLQTEVLVTRPRNRGGFDPKFETPAQLMVPLVSVNPKGTALLAFPFVRGGALGEYPDEYFGLSALSLDYKDTSSLPPYAGGETYMRSTYRIDPADPEGDQAMDLELGGYLAYATRVSLFKQDRGEVKEVFQKFLASLGASNALQSCEVTGQDARGKNLSARISFRNPNQAIERKGETQVRLANLFPLRFSTYDTSRATGFKTNLASRSVERIEAPKPAGRRLEANIPCVPADNALFKVTCDTQDLPDKLIFTREITLRQAKLKAEEMRSLYPQILDLNRIREAYLIVRGEPSAAPPTAPPAASVPKRPKKK